MDLLTKCFGHFIWVKLGWNFLNTWVAVYDTLNFKCHFFSSLLVVILYKRGMRLLIATSIIVGWDKKGWLSLWSMEHHWGFKNSIDCFIFFLKSQKLLVCLKNSSISPLFFLTYILYESKGTPFFIPFMYSTMM